MSKPLTWEDGGRVACPAAGNIGGEGSLPPARFFFGFESTQLVRQVQQERAQVEVQ